MAQVQQGQGQLKNLYHRRLVAPTSSKPCFICHKPTSTVLITPDDRDFFYACPGHLKDVKFATPQDTSNAEDAKKVEEEKKKKEDLEKQIEKVKKEWEEKEKKRKKGKKDKEEKAAEKEEKGEHDKTVQKLEEEKKGIEKVDTDDSKKEDDGPRVFILHRNVLQMRLNREKAAQQSKKDRERLRNPVRFPEVPTGPVT
ncbi:MAG: hypothetical protein M1828_007173 [Chrysothrix sp. TS-e1954]|nr:MAG: hypothetical protein M1828_007173 [Chrysothrix sp. TS-e1954]